MKVDLLKSKFAFVYERCIWEKIASKLHVDIHALVKETTFHTYSISPFLDLLSHYPCIHASIDALQCL